MILFKNINLYKPAAFTYLIIFGAYCLHSEENSKNLSTEKNQNKQQINSPTKKVQSGASYNFGDVKAGARPQHSFTFTNHFDKPITLIKARIPCNCASVAINKIVVPPGESTKFYFRLETKHLSGKILKTFYVITDLKKMPLVKYTMTANIIPKPAPAISIPPFIDMKEIPPNSSHKLQFTIANTGVLNLQIKLQKTSKQIKVTTAMPITLAPAETKKFEFSFKAPAKTGKFFEKIQFKTNIRTKPVVLVLIKGVVK